MNKNKYTLKAKLACHLASCLLPVEILDWCGLATGPTTVQLLPYLLPYCLSIKSSVTGICAS